LSPSVRSNKTPAFELGEYDMQLEAEEWKQRYLSETEIAKTQSSKIKCLEDKLKDLERNYNNQILSMEETRELLIVKQNAIEKYEEIVKSKDSNIETILQENSALRRRLTDSLEAIRRKDEELDERWDIIQECKSCIEELSCSNPEVEIKFKKDINEKEETIKRLEMELTYFKQLHEDRDSQSERTRDLESALKTALAENKTVCGRFLLTWIYF
jgi:uncharacterized protein YoxC